MVSSSPRTHLAFACVPCGHCLCLLPWDSRAFSSREHHDLIYMVFFHYAAMATDKDIFSINILAYCNFVDDCRLAVPGSVGCQKRHLEQLFVAVNSSGVGLVSKDDKLVKHNQAHALNRQEFLQVLVRIATARYVLTGQMNDVSDAVRALIENDVKANVALEMQHDLNVFRQTFCYLMEVSAGCITKPPEGWMLTRSACGTPGGRRLEKARGLSAHHLQGPREHECGLRRQ